MTALDELPDQLSKDKVNTALAASETGECLILMDATAQFLGDIRIEVFTHLYATSSYVQFQRLQGIVETIRDVVLGIIRRLGDLERDFKPIIDAANLIDTLGAHIRLSQKEDLTALLPSMSNIRSLLNNFYTSTREVFDLLKNRDPGHGVG